MGQRHHFQLLRERTVEMAFELCSLSLTLLQLNFFYLIKKANKILTLLLTIVQMILGIFFMRRYSDDEVIYNRLNRIMDVVLLVKKGHRFIECKSSSIDKINEIKKNLRSYIEKYRADKEKSNNE